MGIHICLMKDDKDHKDWDYLRVQNDRDFPDLIDYDKITYKPGDNEEWRPTDLTELRQRIKDKGWSNAERYLHFVDLIENNPDYWVYFSW